MNAPADDVKSLFGKALELASPAERAAFLDRECAARPALRAEVEGLLQALDKAGSFLKQPEAGTAAFPALAERPGTVIGPYKLLQEIGEGGMGVVFLAEQTEPVRRKVALKIIKPGMGSAEVIARFEAERQALALMDHPNIARVLDAGTTPGEPGGGRPGRPYFVMELVKGAPITEYCDQNRLTPRERLELFVPVCQAIQHAHQKGVIHRDIKPSNVLVSLYDGKPVPKVIDFGIAKATNQRLTERTLFTQHGQIVGTFEYMSPEQATLDTLDVDTRSDIYSLGVLLYELLTGTTPLDKERLRQAALGEALRLIREEEPPRPSMRLSQSGGALPLIAAHRKTESQRLPSLMRGDLDWIVMKGLDKDRARRYETASALAADVRRYLAEEPVEARPPSAGYRLRKFVRRHRGPVVAAATVLLAVLGGIVGTTWGMVRAMNSQAAALAAQEEEARQRRTALAAEADATTNALQAAAEAKKAKEARADALRLADDEKAARKQAEGRLYAAHVASAQREFDANNLALVDHYLKQCRPEFRGFEHDLLSTLASKAIRTLEGHGSPVWSVAYSRDGKLLASADGNLLKAGAKTFVKATVKVWDLAKGEVIRNWELETSAVDGLAFSPDGKLLAIATVMPDNAVRIWNVAEEKEVQVFKCQLSSHRRVAFSPDGKLLAAGGEGTVWDLASGKEILKLEGGAGLSVAFSPDGKRVAFGPSVWDLANRKEMLRMKGLTGMLFGVAFSPAGNLLAGGSGDNTVKIWDAFSGDLIHNLKGHSGIVRNVAFSPDGTRLASGAGTPTDGKPVGWSWADGVRLWNVANGREIATLRGHTKSIRCVAFSPDGKSLASGASDKSVKLWGLDVLNQAGLNLQGPAEGKGNVAFSPDGTLLARVSSNRTVTLWDTNDGRIVRTFQHGRLQDASESFTNAHNVGCVSFSPDGHRLLSAFSPTHTRSKFFGTAVYGTAKLWDLSGDKEICTLKEQEAALIDGVAFSRNGKLLATAVSLIAPRAPKPKPGEAMVQVFSAVSGEEAFTLKGHTNRVTGVAFSKEGTRLASSSYDKTIKLWDPVAGKEIRTLEGHTGSVNCVAFSPVDKRLASGSADSAIKLWDSETGKEMLVLAGHTGAVTSLAYSPDGKRLVSASADNTVRLWDTDSGLEVLTLRYADNVRSAVFSPDGKRLAIGTDVAITILDASRSMGER